MSYLSLCDPALRPLWSAAACHPLTSLALLPHQSEGIVAASFYTAVSGAAAICIWFAFPIHYQCLCRVSLMCACASRLCLSYTCDAYALVSLGLVLRIGDSFLTRNLLLDCSLLRLLISLVHFISLLSKDMFLINTRKKQMTPPTPLPHPVFSPLCRPYPILLGHGFYDTPICSLGGDVPSSPPSLPSPAHMQFVVILL